jgi:tRNA threonylcarbamoyladenosine biosynthesis protein TsaB
MILTIKTDQPIAELSLICDSEQIDDYSWQAHRALATTILTKINELLETNDTSFNDLTGLVVYKGPGSFTGLRIGATVANTPAYSLDMPVVGTNGVNWRNDGAKRITNNENDHIVKPEYGGEANITAPKK